MIIDIEKEKKKNIKLAIGIAALGIFASMALYAAIFALMILRPGLIFGIMPFPALSKDIVGIGDKLYVISKEMDFSNFSIEHKKEPQEKFTLGILENGKISSSAEINRFDSLTGGDAKIYFLSNGLYTTFDGKQWRETKTDAIGKNPKAVWSPEGLYVLSDIKNSLALNLIKDDGASSIPLPEEYLSDKSRKCSARLLWFQGKLYLLWPYDEQFNWASYDGKGWSSVESTENQGIIKAIADDERMYLFNEHLSGPQPDISFTVFENGSWSEPKDLNVHGLFIDYYPLIYRGKPHIFVRGFFSEELYEIENGSAINPVRLGGSFFGREFFSKIILLIVISNLAFLLFIYLISVFIGKIKLRTWKTDSAEYEFASLFRRFLAKIIDTMLILIPPAALMAYLLANQNFWANPFIFFFAGLLAFLYLIIGNFLYHSLLEGIYGKTAGKKICGIVVLKDDFSKCGLLAGFLRNLMRLADNFFYYLVAVVSMTGTLKWQRLGDVVAGTVVVREKKSR